MVMVRVLEKLGFPSALKENVPVPTVMVTPLGAVNVKLAAPDGELTLAVHPES